jgi:hypothetical protein
LGSRFDRSAATSVGEGRRADIARLSFSTGVVISWPPARFIRVTPNLTSGSVPRCAEQPIALVINGHTPQLAAGFEVAENFYACSGEEGILLESVNGLEQDREAPFLSVVRARDLRPCEGKPEFLSAILRNSHRALVPRVTPPLENTFFEIHVALQEYEWRYGMAELAGALAPGLCVRPRDAATALLPLLHDPGRTKAIID